MTCMGVDWSGAENVPDWRVAFEEGGVKFVILRALRSNGEPDPQFPIQRQTLEEIGVTVFAYDFFNASLDVNKQADDFLRIIDGLKTPVYDFENAFGKDSATLIEDSHNYLQQVAKGTGGVPTICTGPSFWDQYMDDSFGQYHLMVMEYGVQQPRIPKGFSAAAFWQDASGEPNDGCGLCGTIQPAGFRDPIDRDWYMPGDHADLVRRFNLG